MYFILQNFFFLTTVYSWVLSEWDLPWLVPSTTCLAGSRSREFIYLSHTMKRRHKSVAATSCCHAVELPCSGAVDKWQWSSSSLLILEVFTLTLQNSSCNWGQIKNCQTSQYHPHIRMWGLFRNLPDSRNKIKYIPDKFQWTLSFQNSSLLHSPLDKTVQDLNFRRWFRKKNILEICALLGYYTV